MTKEIPGLKNRDPGCTNWGASVVGRYQTGYDIRVYLGWRARVHTCVGGYQLPEGLPENAEVRLEQFDTGYWTVRYEGKLFKVAMSCVGRGGMVWARPMTNDECQMTSAKLRK
jgi:hypothetical protein